MISHEMEAPISCKMNTWQFRIKKEEEKVRRAFARGMLLHARSAFFTAAPAEQHARPGNLPIVHFQQNSSCLYLTPSLGHVC